LLILFLNFFYEIDRRGLSGRQPGEAQAQDIVSAIARTELNFLNFQIIIFLNNLIAAKHLTHFALPALDNGRRSITIKPISD